MLFVLFDQELNSFNYLDLYKLADLFNLTLLEKAVVDFLVKHLSELLKSHPEEILALPYCLIREVLKSDRLTSLSEEQIWQVLYKDHWPMFTLRETNTAFLKHCIQNHGYQEAVEVKDMATGCFF